MKNALPESITYVIVGGGVHGLSTAWHRAMELDAKGKGGGRDIILLDKTGPRAPGRRESPAAACATFT